MVRDDLHAGQIFQAHMSPRSANAQLAQILVNLPIALPLRNDEDEFSAEAIGLVSAAGSSQTLGCVN